MSSSSFMKQVWNSLVAATFAVTFTLFMAIWNNLNLVMVYFPYWSMLCFMLASVSSLHALNNRHFLFIFIICFVLGSGFLGWFALTNNDMKEGRSSLTFADLKFNVLCSVIARCVLDVLVCALNP